MSLYVPKYLNKSFNTFARRCPWYTFARRTPHLLVIVYLVVVTCSGLTLRGMVGGGGGKGGGDPPTSSEPPDFSI